MNKQRVKRLQMPCSHEQLQTFDERPNMRKKPVCARFSCKTSGFRMVGAMRERPWRGAARSLFIHVCERETMNKQRVKRALLLPGVLHTAKRPCAYFPHRAFAFPINFPVNFLPDQISCRSGHPNIYPVLSLFSPASFRLCLPPMSAFSGPVLTIYFVYF